MNASEFGSLHHYLSNDRLHLAFYLGSKKKKISREALDPLCTSAF